MGKTNKFDRVLFTGSNGFPYGSAVIQRQMQLANSLLESGYKVNVINRRGVHSKLVTNREKILTNGEYFNIRYIHCSIIPYKSKFFIKRNIFKVLGLINEFFIIGYYRLFKNSKFLFNNSISINQLKYYYFLTKVFKMELVYDYVEMVYSLRKRDMKTMELAKNSFDNQFFNYVDKVITISDFLDIHVRKVAPIITRIKIPPIIDFTFFDEVKPKIDAGSFFLFCGSAAYMDIIVFIIKSYHKSKSIQNDYSLKLIINGTVNEINFVRKHIKKSKLQNEVEVLSNLAYSDLISFYKAARALLIPMKDNLQDQARFPFKICEYVASNRPIVTSNVPLINEFFENNKTALIANVDDSDEFANKLNRIIEIPLWANEIGQNAYDMGKHTFNFKTYSKEIDKLLQS